MLEEDVIKLKDAVRKLEGFLAPQIKKAQEEEAKAEKERLAKVSADIEQRRKDAIDKSRQEAVAAAKRDGREPPVYSEGKDATP